MSDRAHLRPFRITRTYVVWATDEEMAMDAPPPRGGVLDFKPLEGGEMTDSSYVYDPHRPAERAGLSHDG